MPVGAAAILTKGGGVTMPNTVGFVWPGGVCLVAHGG
jgi:hypothetical protein